MIPSDEDDLKYYTIGPLAWALYVAWLGSTVVMFAMNNAALDIIGFFSMLLCMTVLGNHYNRLRDERNRIRRQRYLARTMYHPRQPDPFMSEELRPWKN